MLLRDFWGNRLVRFISWTIAIVSLYLLQPYRAVVIRGDSMMPNYKNFQIELATTDVSNLKRGDVVVLDTDHGTIVKRISYLQGDWVDGVYCFGQWMYARDVVVAPGSLHKFAKLGKAVIPGGYVFVTGDNPTVSLDSRQLGAFPLSSVRCVLLSSKKDETETEPDDLTYSNKALHR